MQPIISDVHYFDDIGRLGSAWPGCILPLNLHRNISLTDRTSIIIYGDEVNKTRTDRVLFAKFDMFLFFV